jgi:hypothetical protein
MGWVKKGEGRRGGAIRNQGERNVKRSIKILAAAMLVGSAGAALAHPAG